MATSVAGVPDVIRVGLAFSDRTDGAEPFAISAGSIAWQRSSDSAPGRALGIRVCETGAYGRPSISASSAFCVWSRFSASSQIAERGP